MLVVVYMGAVMVLFLFVVMMLDIRIDRDQRRLLEAFSGGCSHWCLDCPGDGGGFDGGALAPWMKPSLSLSCSMPKARCCRTPIPRRWVSLMYTEYLFPIEVAAAILLVAMIAAIALTLRKRKDAKTPNITGQINARAQDRLTLVSMPATQAAATAKTQGEETK